MPRSFNIDWRSVARDPKAAVRAALGVLLVANLAAAWFVFQTPGGSLEQLESDVITARKSLVARQQRLEQLKRNVAMVEKARDAGNHFMSGYFLDRQNAYSSLEIELGEAAKSTGVKPRERTFTEDLIEGSDQLGMLTLNANFEGNYADLIEFINLLDRSKRLLIIDSMTAQPQQGGGLLINVKMNAFYRQEAAH